MPHTQSRMAESTENDIHALIGAEFGVDTRSLEFRTTDDQVASLRHDLVRIHAYPLLPKGLQIGGAVLDVDTGSLHPVPLDTSYD